MQYNNEVIEPKPVVVVEPRARLSHSHVHIETKYSDDGKILYRFDNDITDEVVIPEGVTKISRYAFNACQFESIILPNSLKELDGFVFQDCKSLKRIVIPKNVKKIGVALFFHCDNLESVVVDEENTKFYSPKGSNTIVERKTNILYEGCKDSIIVEGITGIRTFAFFGLPNLQAIKIPSTVQVIGANAFTRCLGVKELYIPPTVRKIHSEAFTANHFERIIVDDENPVYDSRNNCNAIIASEQNELRVGCQNTIIPEGIEVICHGAFVWNKNLKSIKIPSSVTKIEREAFFGCANLTDIDFGRFGEESSCIERAAFVHCDSLKSVSFAKGAYIDFDDRAFDSEIMKTILAERKIHFNSIAPKIKDEETKTRIDEELKQAASVNLASLLHKLDELVRNGDIRNLMNDKYPDVKKNLEAIGIPMDVKGFSQQNYSRLVRQYPGTLYPLN